MDSSFCGQNIPKMKRHCTIVLSAATYLHVTPSYGTSTFFQHFFFNGECVAFYLANRNRGTFMPLRQTNHILIFLFSGFMFDVRRQSFRGEIETILMNLNLNQ